MGTNKLRTKRGRTPAKSHADKQRIYESWLRKIDEYMELSPEQLNTLLLAKTEKGTYLKALERAIEMKQELLDKQKAQNGNNSEGSIGERNSPETIGNQRSAANVGEQAADFSS